MCEERDEELVEEDESEAEYDVDKGRLAKIFFISFLLRVLVFMFSRDWLASRPELVSPLTNYRRVLDGVALKADFGTAYDGDLVLVQPMLLSFFSPFSYVSKISLFLLFCFFDFLAAFFLLCSVFHLNIDKNVGFTIYKCYLFNPFTITSCAIFSVSSFYNMVTSLFIYCFVSGAYLSTIVCLAFISSLCFHPIALLGSVILRFPSSRAFSTLVVLSASITIFVLLNFMFNGLNWNFVKSTYGSLLQMDDLNPNSGVFWYLFIQVFPQFRQFYLAVCQCSLIFYIIPLTFALRKDPHLHVIISLLLITIFSPYPTLNSGSVYLALLPSLEKYWKQPVRFVLLLGGIMVTCAVLMPVMWHMWIVVGSGNANFYFAVTLLYNFAQIYLMLDLLFAYYRSDLQAVCEDHLNLKTTLTFRSQLTKYEN
ncbi:unnamed protein product [Auanema sp. JU1783]|nr:unnamed protein product [Auanema sp. JU1783]